MAFNSPPSRPVKRKTGDATLCPPPKRNTAARFQPDVSILVQEENLCTDIAPVKIDPFVAIFGNLSLEPGLLRLPNEILDNVASFLTPTTTIHMIEGMSVSRVQKHPRSMLMRAPNPVIKQYKLELSALRHLALVCRRFRSVAENRLYRDIGLPRRERRCLSVCEEPNVTLLCLARTLFDRPDLAARVKSLRLWVLDRSLVLREQAPYAYVFERALRLFPKMQLSFEEYMQWTKELDEFQGIAICAIVVSLLPKLKIFEMNSPISCSRMFPRMNIWPGEALQDSRRAVSYLGVALRLNPTLTSIHLNTPFRVPNLPTSNLTTLTLDILCFGDRLDLLDELQALPSVHTLLITLNLALLKWADFNQAFPLIHPRDGLRIFMRDVVPNLTKFEIQSLKGTLQYWEGEVDRRGNKLSALRLEEAEDIEFNPLHVRGHDSGAFNWLLIVLLPVKDRLLQLSLPSNWYSSTGKHVKAIPSLKRLTRLVALQLPHVAVVSNAYGKDFNPALHCTPATKFLPTSLEILTLTQVDIDTCSWLEDALVEHHLFPRLRCVYLYLREDYWACVPQGFEDVARNAGVRVVVYWREHAKVL